MEGRLDQDQDALLKTQEQLVATHQAQDVLISVAELMQEKAHKHLCTVVSRCLSTVFGEDFRLEVRLDRKRGKTEVKFVFVKPGGEESPMVTSGGQREVACLGLRLVALTLAIPPRRPLLILDEPFQGLERENLIKVGRLLEMLTEELGLQVIIVTHNQELQIGDVVYIGS